MNNFEKKLEDVSDEELRLWINTRNPHFTSLASDELTRRSLNSLEKTTEKASEKTDKFNRITTAFTIVIMFMTYAQVIIAIYEAFGKNLWAFAIITAIFVGALLWLMKSIDKKIL